MIISCLGHAKFLLALENGMRIVTDPFDAGCGYPVTPVTADAVLVSHHHHDHDAVDTVSGHPKIIDAAGVYTLSTDVRVTAVAACHDDVGGAKRGTTLLFVVEAEGLRVGHLGDLGHPLTPALVDAVGPLDVVMLPVGGFYTMDAATAKGVAKALRARVILPMHYRTAFNKDWPIAPVEDFTRLFDEPAIQAPLLRVTKADLTCQPKLAILTA